MLKMNLFWHMCFKWVDIFLPCFGSEICYLSPTKMLPTPETFIEIVSLHLNEPVRIHLVICTLYIGGYSPEIERIDTPKNDVNLHSEALNKFNKTLFLRE